MWRQQSGLESQARCARCRDQCFVHVSSLLLHLNKKGPIVILYFDINCTVNHQVRKDLERVNRSLDDQITERFKELRDATEIASQLHTRVATGQQGELAQIRNDVTLAAARSNDLKSDIDSLKGEMRADSSAVRGEIRADSTAVRGELLSLRSDVQTMKALMTEILKKLDK